MFIIHITNHSVDNIMSLLSVCLTPLDLPLKTGPEGELKSGLEMSGRRQGSGEGERELKRPVADLILDNAILKEVTRGNF